MCEKFRLTLAKALLQCPVASRKGGENGVGENGVGENAGEIVGVKGLAFFLCLPLVGLVEGFETGFGPRRRTHHNKSKHRAVVVVNFS